MFYVHVFYKKCPTCRQTWSPQLSHAAAIQIGKEVFVCKCGIAWPTGRVEWAHITPRMRRSYKSGNRTAVRLPRPFVIRSAPVVSSYSAGTLPNTRARTIFVPNATTNAGNAVMTGQIPSERSRSCRCWLVDPADSE